MIDEVFSIRPAGMEDVPAIMPIYDSARAFMRRNHNPSQWVGGYPQQNLIEEDIRQGRFYIGQTGSGENLRLAGVFCYQPGPDPTYAHIENGTWPDDRPYYVVHRIAAAPGVRGFALFCFDWCLRQHPVLRIDTHADNTVMLHLLQKSGFAYCGIIRVHDGTPRRAFQKSRPHDR